ncbi:MnhB domain-containing protein [Chloroflexota bacterium]
MIKQHESIVIRITSTAMVPFIQLFALYVVFHGHYGPGGGFQGGVLFAVSFMLLRLCLGREMAAERFSPRLAMVIASAGMLVFMTVGILPLFTGGVFLDYGHLPIPGVSEAGLRYLGILIAEIGIALAVFGTLVLLFDNLAGENW